MKSGTSGNNTGAEALTGSGELTPLLRQFQQIKAQHPEHILFFRCGDFYEMFFDDARTCSEVMGITLTSRGTDTRGEPVPLAGIPYHSVEGYLARMIRAGYRVAICEQTENPKTAKGVIRREVVRVVTPGTVLEDNLLDNKANNYLVALVEEKGALGLAALDFSTGQFAVTEFRGDHATQECMAELVRLGPSELVVARDQRTQLEALLNNDSDFSVQKAPIMAVVDPAAVSPWAARDALLVQMEVRDLSGFGAEGHPLAVRAAGAILAYLKETQRTALGHVNELRVYHPGESMVLDATTQRSLELVANLTDATRRHTVLEVLDRTATSMGARLLRGWLLQPLRDPARINARLDAVETFVRDGLGRARTLESLKAVNDLERIVSRSVCRTANGRDLLALRNSLQQVPKLRRLLGEAAGYEAGIRGERIAEGSVAASSIAPSAVATGITEASGIAIGAGGGVVEVASAASTTTLDGFHHQPQDEEPNQNPDYNLHGNTVLSNNSAAVDDSIGDGEIQFQGDSHRDSSRLRTPADDQDGMTFSEDEGAPGSGIAEEEPGAPTAPSLLEELLAQLNPLLDLTSALEAAIVDQPPQSVREGGMIREGFDSRLDELRLLSADSKSWIARMRQQEIERTGISNLKIGFNRVFGYYIEVSHSHAAKVPSTYIRKQTLAGAERFVTAELKEKEEVILHAEERSQELEFELFEALRDQVCARAREIQGTARAVAQLDVLLSLSQVAVSNRYCRPTFAGKVPDGLHNAEPGAGKEQTGDGFNSEFRTQNSELYIRDGRHPVLESLRMDQPFVPNDTLLDSTESQVLLITGPNMAGKSTYIRQVALITLLAHVGSFVPASEARICPVDRIFTRVGAMDQLAKGQSTFLVEMSETANILNNATDHSLVILDEIGRGTSTYDGLSIAWAVAEYLHNTKGRRPKTLFATHYHELTSLEGPLPRLKNYHVAVSEDEGRLAFLYRILRGATDRSYGIHAAQVAGLPRRAIDRAKRILADLERGNAIHVGGSGGAAVTSSREKPVRVEERTVQLTMFDAAADPVRAKLRDLDVNGLTPMQALSYLADLCAEAKKG